VTVSECRSTEERSLSPFRTGYRFGRDERYEVLSLLGAGATAVVLLVHDHVRGRRAAAKLLTSYPGESTGEALFRARAEAHTLRRLHHENIVKVYEVGRCNETAYVLLEHRDGIALDELVEKGPLPIPCALDIAAQIASALAHAHAAGVLHLDVKPGNVWVAREGGVKLLDFGMDADFERARREGKTAPKLLFGTPAYMAPEQWRLMTPDARTDVWALGMTLYELVTGELPFAKPGEHPILICEAVVSNGAPPSISKRLNAPAALDELLRRALANDRAKRFQTAGEFLQALKSVAQNVRNPSSAPSPSLPVRAHRARRRRRDAALVA
jgi:serine/threonine protein kinase